MRDNSGHGTIKDNSRDNRVNRDVKEHRDTRDINYDNRYKPNNRSYYSNNNNNNNNNNNMTKNNRNRDNNLKYQKKDNEQENNKSSKENNNNNNKDNEVVSKAKGEKSVLVLDIEVNKGQIETLEVNEVSNFYIYKYKNKNNKTILIKNKQEDDPNELAKNFCDKHKMNEQLQQYIADQIISNLNKINTTVQK